MSPLLMSKFILSVCLFFLPKSINFVLSSPKLMCSSKSELPELLKQIKEISKKRGLLLNTKKTTNMVVDSNRADIWDHLLTRPVKAARK